MKKTITEQISVSMIDSACSICTMPFEAPCSVTELACHKNHALHTDCLNDWLQHCESKDQTAKCPICRANIDKDRLIKKNIKNEAMTTPDAFMDLDVDPDVDDHFFGAPKGMPVVMRPDPQQ